MARNFELSEVRELQQEMLNAAREIAERRGLNVRLSKGKYGEVGQVSVEFLRRDVPTPEANDFVRYARMYGLETSDLGLQFHDVAGHRYTISGINPRARSMPVLATEATTGRTYKFRAETVQRLLGR